jgi:hypothetical protein
VRVAARRTPQRRQPMIAQQTIPLETFNDDGLIQRHKDIPTQ